MGFELNRLMAQYGVSTPTMQNYAGAAKAGTAPTAPIAPTEVPVPVNPGKFTLVAPKTVSAPGANATPEQIENYAKYAKEKAIFDEAKEKHTADTQAYNTAVRNYPKAVEQYSTDLSTYNTAKAKYGTDLASYNAANAAYFADKKAYDDYIAEYRSRLMSTPMYLQDQFKLYPPSGAITNDPVTPPTPTSTEDLYRVYLGRDPQKAELKNWEHFGPEVNMIERQEFIKAARPELKERNLYIPNTQLYRDTGSYYGDQLRSPVYGSPVSPSITNAVIAPGGTTGDVVTVPGGTTGDVVPISGSDNTSGPAGFATTGVGNVINQIYANNPSDADLPTYATTTPGVMNEINQLLNANHPTIPDVGRVTPGVLNSINELYTNNKVADENAVVTNPTSGAVVTNPTSGAVVTNVGAGAATPGVLNSINQLYESPTTNLAGLANQYNVSSPTPTNGYYVAGNAPKQTVNFLQGYNPVKFMNDPAVPANARWDAAKGQYFVPYAHGGSVKTHYATGNLVDLSKKYANPSNLPNIYGGQDISPGFITSAMTPPDTRGAPTAMTQERPPIVPSARPSTPQPTGGMADIQTLFDRYMLPDPYAEDLKTARANVKSKSAAFANMITQAMQEEEPRSKEEMYWRLAAAFGSPTRTGAFTENLSLAGKEMAEYAKSEREAKRAQKALKLQMQLKGAELDLTGAKEDLETIRALAAEGIKDKREIAKTILTQYIKSGEPESAAGKQAKDEGLKPGTPEFQSRVTEIAKMNIDAQTAKIESLLAGITTTQANLALAEARLKLQQEQAKKLTPGEVKLKSETEDLVAASEQALGMLKQAYKLNPNTFDNSLLELGQRKLLESTASNDPRVIATREMENLLGKDALLKLKASVGANPTEGERKVIMDLEGIGAKSREERARIMLNAYAELQKTVGRHKKRLNEINAGLYRETTPSGGIE